MDHALAQIPAVSWLSVVSLGFCGLLYLGSRIRKSDMEVLRGANNDLRQSIEDKGKEIDVLKTHILSMEKRIGDLEKRNKTLEEVVSIALVEYFKKHPEVAVKLKGVVSNG